MFSGGDYSEVGRWLWNFVEAHAKRENLRVEALVDAAGAREGKSYGVRLRLAERLLPPADQAPVEMAYADVAAGKGRLAWCDAFAVRVRTLAGGFGAPRPATSQTV
jgi:hypothetical protein